MAKGAGLDAPSPADSPDGLILAGGRSRRMRSPQMPDIDKGLRLRHGRPLVAGVCDYLRSQGVGQVLISTNQHLDTYRAYGQVLTDSPQWADCGPLAGVLAGLQHSQASWVLVLPVDVLQWPRHFLAGLQAAATPRHPAYAQSNGPHPLCLLVHTGMATSLQAFLHSGQRQVQAWLQACDARGVLFDEPDCLVNLNTPEDWQRWAL
ncbi:MAG: molybdenum cofactor guanylyltransferase [Castellaniella sp.]